MNNINKQSFVGGESSSDDDDDIDSSDDEHDCPPSATGSRDKRNLQWCALDPDTFSHRPRTHNHHNNVPHHHNNLNRPHNSHHHPPVKVVWPPPSNATPSTSSSNQWRYGDVRLGNPKLGSKMQLYSQTGYHLAIYPDGKVRGTSDENDLHTYLELSSAGYPGHVRIRGLLTNLYVAMDRRGRLYAESRTQTSAEADPMMESTVFLESFQGSYNAYLSRRYAHLGWYIGIKKNGKFKRGPLTRYGQKAVKFLPRRQRFE